MDPLAALEGRYPALALFENRRRAEQIVHVFVKYGLADVAAVSSHPLLAQLAGRVAPDPHLVGLSRGERLRDAFLELGTTFIKIGQILSTRTDLVGPDIAATLASLQSDDPADSPEQIARTVAEEFGVPEEQAFDAFASFDTTPLASASVGQVCVATTADGRPVVVKVRHAGVAETVGMDLAIISALAHQAERDIPLARSLGIERVARDLATSLRHELDFSRELVSLTRMTANFAESPEYVFPTPLPDLCGSAVLTETRLEGVPLSGVLGSLGSRTDDVIHMIADMYFRMIFVDGLFHADPHPGNLLLLPDGRLGVIDFGKVGRLRDGLREAFVDFLAAVFTGDLEETTRCMLAIAPGPTTLDSDDLEAELDAWIDQYFPGATGGLNIHMNLGAAVTDLLGIVRRHQLRMPGDISLMLLVVVQLQGLVELSGSSLTLTQILLPYAEQLQSERMSPRRIARRTARSLRRWEHLLEVLPDDLTRLVEAGSRGELRVPFNVEGVDQPVNRLAYALVASAAITGAGQLLSRRVGPSVVGMSVPGLATAAAGAYLAWGVVHGARKSGGLFSRSG